MNRCWDSLYNQIVALIGGTGALDFDCVHYCPGDDFFIPRSRLMARYLALDLRFFDLNCFSPELASGRLLGTRRRLPTMRDESWPNGFFPGRRSSSTL